MHDTNNHTVPSSVLWLVKTSTLCFLPKDAMLVTNPFSPYVKVHRFLKRICPINAVRYHQSQTRATKIQLLAYIV